MNPRNILVKWGIWYFFEMPNNILKGWGNFILFNLNYFSVGMLIKTFLSPWRRYGYSQGKGFDIGNFLEVQLSNLIFRILGAVIRSFLIIIGVLSETLIIFIGLILFLLWLFLPFLIIAGLWFGLRLIYG